MPDRVAAGQARPARTDHCRLHTNDFYRTAQAGVMIPSAPGTTAARPHPPSPPGPQGPGQRCPVTGCGRWLSPSSSMTRHLDTHYPRGNPWSCAVMGCGKTFAMKAELERHRQSHNLYRPHRCPVVGCGKSFTQKQSAQIHLRCHTGERPYVCSFEGCGKRFSQQPQLRNHSVTHTGERAWPCPYPGCGRDFTLRSNRDVHLRTHTGEKPYVCPVRGCALRFAQQSNMKRHALSHTRPRTGSRIWPCGLEGCHRMFSRQSSRAVHMASHVRKGHCPSLPETCDRSRDPEKYTRPPAGRLPDPAQPPPPPAAGSGPQALAGDRPDRAPLPSRIAHFPAGAAACDDGSLAGTTGDQAATEPAPQLAPPGWIRPPAAADLSPSPVAPAPASGSAVRYRHPAFVPDTSPPVAMGTGFAPTPCWHPSGNDNAGLYSPFGWPVPPAFPPPTDAHAFAPCPDYLMPGPGPDHYLPPPPQPGAWPWPGTGNHPVLRGYCPGLQTARFAPGWPVPPPGFIRDTQPR